MRFPIDCPCERKKALTWVLCSQLIVQVNLKGSSLCFLVESGNEIFRDARFLELMMICFKLGSES